MQLLPGTRLAHYEIAAPIGAGAMSEVYLARDVNLNLEVAVKVVSAKLLATDSDARSRFEKEAQAAARLSHPNICRVFFYGVENGWPFYAMELIRGVTLQQVIDQRLRMSWAQVIDIIVQAVRGLRHASSSEIANRDIKPANLMIDQEGVVRVVDFGLSAWLGSNPYLSDRGLVVGTPSYVSPEAIRRETVNWLSDQYSLGISLYHLITGRLPYDGEDPTLVMRLHLEAPVPDLAELDDQYPKGLCSIVRCMMDKDPTERFASYNELLNKLDYLADELDERLDEELAYCELCRRNTTSKGASCASCGATRSVHAPRYAQVVLTGYKDEQGEIRTADYLARSIGRGPEVVSRILSELPFRLSHHLDYEQAVNMQRRLSDLGARIEVHPIREEGLPAPGERLPYGPAQTRRRLAPRPEPEVVHQPAPATVSAPIPEIHTHSALNKTDGGFAVEWFALGLGMGLAIGLVLGVVAAGILF